MRKLILKALAEYPGRPVLVPVVANIIAQSKEAIKMIKGLMLRECERYGFDKGRITPQRIASELEQRVRAALPKMAKDGLVKHLDLIEMRAGKMIGRESRGCCSPGKPVRQRPDQAHFREDIKKLRVVFSDLDQLNKCQGAYEITEAGLSEVGSAGLAPSYTAKPIAM